MNSKIKRIGNSKGIIIPAAVIETMGLKEKDQLNIQVIDNKIVLSKVDSFNPLSLADLFIGYSGPYPSEIVFNDPKGREVY